MSNRRVHTERLQEYASNAGLKPTLIDREKGIIGGVKILGLISKNGRTYSEAAVAKAVPLYENARVNVNHSGKDARDYRDRMGHLVNIRAAQDGLYADFQFNPKHALAEQLIWDAEHAPGDVGFSHVIDAKTRRDKGNVVVEEIVHVASVDLVADPATTRGLFEQTEPTQEGFDMDLKDLTIEQLKESRQDLVDILQGKDATSTLTADLATAKESLATATAELTTIKAREAEQAKTLAIAEELKTAKFNTTDKKAVSEVFMAALKAAPDAAARKVLIEDRQSLLKERVIQPITGAPPMAPLSDAPAGGTPISVEDTLRRIT
jgi:hypothetical protein